MELPSRFEKLTGCLTDMRTYAHAMRQPGEDAKIGVGNDPEVGATITQLLVIGVWSCCVSKAAVALTR